ncbi:MAG TPA: cytochrome b/b6 domain-containing protein [Chryseolinea sp.]|nr:cytochrome b/b6 domain-containing protein [Chryseolinea sp.]HPM29068.1 cytochrome b/b6 domain-containing protein [Chryseolinea sp.]
METIHHSRWVKISHWVITVSFLLLAFTGFIILMCHPRLYWGEVGNDLTPALFELPISRNYQHGGWDASVPFFNTAGSQVSASRTYDIFNQNGWGRSLHFLSAWFLVITGVIYLFTGIFTGHFRKRMVPTREEFLFRALWRDVTSHIKQHFGYNPKYNVIQKYSYLIVIFVIMPLIALTGLTMSPAVSAGYPVLLKMFGGVQSARTLHFFASVALELFFVVHVIMIIRSGFKQQIKGMTFGK